MSGIDIASNSALLSVAEKLDTQNIFLAAIAGKDDGLHIKDWATVQAVVRAGLAPKVFSIGDQFTVSRNNEKLVFDVIGFDHDVPANSQFTHSMTLQMHDCYSGLAFDAPEALYYCEEELSAGTYYFTIHAYEVDYGGGKSYCFTLTKPVPAGGQLVFEWKYGVHALDAPIKSYKDCKSEEFIESVSVSEGTEGIFLGVTDGSAKNLNNAQKITRGNNNWSQSAIRQWLNSDTPDDKWWNCTNIYDRAPDYKANPGFLNGMDEDFVSVLGKVKKRTALNIASDGGGYLDSAELMFLLSRTEINGEAENNILEGNQYAYYKNFSSAFETDVNLIKYFNGSVINWWLRTASSTNCNNVRNITSDGSFKTSGAFITNWGISPACCII